MHFGCNLDIFLDIVLDDFLDIFPLNELCDDRLKHLAKLLGLSLQKIIIR